MRSIVATLCIAVGLAVGGLSGGTALASGIDVGTTVPEVRPHGQAAIAIHSSSPSGQSGLSRLAAGALVVANIQVGAPDGRPRPGSSGKARVAAAVPPVARVGACLTLNDPSDCSTAGGTRGTASRPAAGAPPPPPARTGIAAGAASAAAEARDSAAVVVRTGLGVAAPRRPTAALVEAGQIARARVCLTTNQATPCGASGGSEPGGDAAVTKAHAAVHAAAPTAPATATIGARTAPATACVTLNAADCTSRTSSPTAAWHAGDAALVAAPALPTAGRAVARVTVAPRASLATCLTLNEPGCSAPSPSSSSDPGGAAASTAAAATLQATAPAVPAATAASATAAAAPLPVVGSTSATLCAGLNRPADCAAAPEGPASPGNPAVAATALGQVGAPVIPASGGASGALRAAPIASFDVCLGLNSPSPCVPAQPTGDQDGGGQPGSDGAGDQSPGSQPGAGVEGGTPPAGNPATGTGGAGVTVATPSIVPPGPGGPVGMASGQSTTTSPSAATNEVRSLAAARKDAGSRADTPSAGPGGLGRGTAPRPPARPALAGGGPVEGTLAAAPRLPLGLPHSGAGGMDAMDPLLVIPALLLAALAIKAHRPR